VRKVSGGEKLLLRMYAEAVSLQTDYRPKGAGRDVLERA
jgi:hypothetical protein